MKKGLWRWLTGGFLVLMLAVVVAADRGTLPAWVRSLYRFPGGDWVGHFVLYGMLAFLAARAFSQRVLIGRLSIPIPMLVVILLAALEELSQFWFPLRTPDWRDLAFGVLGILLVPWLASFLPKKDQHLFI